MSFNLSKDVKVTRVMNSVAAGQTQQDSSILDMQNYDGVMFVALLGTVTDGSLLDLRAQSNTLNQSGGMADVTGSATSTVTAATDSGHQLLVDVYRPVNRYVRARLNRTTQNAGIDGILAIQYRGRVKPTVHDAGVIASALAVGA